MRVRQHPLPNQTVIRGNDMTFQIIPLHRNAKNISGLTFGRLTAIACVSKTKSGLNQWLCVCSCGTETVTLQKTLANGGTQSCGCIADETFRKNCIEFDTSIHGMSGTPEHKTWKGIRARCSNPNEPNYKYYGGRGISVCKRWQKFESFFSDMGKRPTSKHSIDRINNEGNYAPENCRWATQTQQMRNTRSNRYITHDGKTMCVAAWAERLGMRPNMVVKKFTS